MLGTAVNALCSFPLRGTCSSIVVMLVGRSRDRSLLLTSPRPPVAVAVDVAGGCGCSRCSSSSFTMIVFSNTVVVTVGAVEVDVCAVSRDERFEDRQD